MHDRAYHLQFASHRAVASAIRTGRLVRQPCEVCGGAGQAHHDSYYPERWLDVRWLCGTHHREWHQRNEAEWPTIYEYHPSDAEHLGGGRPGRPSKPWFRTGTGRWYVTLNGKAHNLGPDREAAHRRFQELLGLR